MKGRGEKNEWKMKARGVFSLILADGIWIHFYLPRFPRLKAKWEWGVYGVGQEEGGRGDTEAEAKTAVILKARGLITAKRDELDNALATLNAAATLDE